MSEGLVIRSLSDSDRPLWKRFIYESQNGTLFHDLDFLAYHPASRFRSRHLLFWEKGNLVAVCPAADQEENGQKVLISHPGASWGGLVFPKGFKAENVNDLIVGLVSYAREEKIERIVITLSPEFYSEKPDHALRFALHLSGFRVVKRQLSGAVALSFFPSCLKKTALQKAQQSRRTGVRVVRSDDYRAFYPVLVQNRAKHGATPTHSLDELLRIDQLIPGRLALFLAEHESRPIAGALLFLVNGNVALSFYIAHKEEYKQHRATNLLLMETMQWAQQEGFRYYDMGTSMIGEKPNWSLVAFKETFGAQSFLRDTYELVLT